VGLGVTAGFALAIGLYDLLTPSQGEKLLRTFDEEAARRTAGGITFARTEQKLTELAERDRSARVRTFWVAEGVGLLGAAVVTGELILDRHSTDRLGAGQAAAFYTGCASIMVSGALLFSTESPIERLVRIYHQDPGLQLHLGPTAGPSRLGLGMSGRF
jgi:hypothetical protein